LAVLIWYNQNMVIWLQLIVLVLEIVALLLIIFIFVSGIHSVMAGAPFVPMKKSVIKNLLVFGELKAGDVFYDLGSGDGRVLRTASEFNVKIAKGYEIAHWPYLMSVYLNRKKKMKNVEIKHGNSFNADLSDADFIYLYLFPPLVDKLAGKIEKEARAGAKILCPAFSVDTNKHPRFKLKKEAKFDTMATYLYEVI